MHLVVLVEDCDKKRKFIHDHILIQAISETACVITFLPFDFILHCVDASMAMFLLQVLLEREASPGLSDLRELPAPWERRVCRGRRECPGRKASLAQLDPSDDRHACKAGIVLSDEHV